MRLSILVQLTVCMSHAAAFAPTAVKEQLSVSRLSYASDPFAVVESETEVLSNASEDKTSAAAFARKVMHRYESAEMNNGPSSITSTEPGTPSANDKKTPKMPDRSILDRTLGVARDKPVTKAKQNVAKEAPRPRRTLTPMERKLASEEVLRMDDSIKPVKVGLDSPPIFAEKKAETVPRTGTVEEFSSALTLSFTQPEEQATHQDSTVHRMLTVERKETSSPPRFAEWPAPVTPTTATAEHRPRLAP